MVTIVRIFQILRNFFSCFVCRQTRNIESFEEPSTQVSCTKILSQKKTCELGLGCASYNPILCALLCLFSFFYWISACFVSYRQYFYS